MSDITVEQVNDILYLAGMSQVDKSECDRIADEINKPKPLEGWAILFEYGTRIMYESVQDANRRANYDKSAVRVFKWREVLDE